jgi:branched-chain amino acid aminotransferase
MQLMRDWGLRVTERQIAIDEVMAAGRDGTLKEMWGTGTAAVVSPVGTLGYKGEDVLINGGEIGDVTRRLYDAITGLQYGRSNDPHGWTSIVRKGVR